MPLSEADLYKAHVRNLRAVDDACTQVAGQLKSCIASNRPSAASALLKTLTLLVGAWAEVRLSKLLFEPKGFDASQRAIIQSQQSRLHEWQKALELAVRRRYKVPTAALSETTIPATAFFRYREMSNIVENDLRPIIEIRNKLAHGQWSLALNSDADDVSKVAMMLLNRENALSINFKKQILECLAQIAHNVVTSAVAFDRDFDKHYAVLAQAKTNLNTRSYEVWSKSLREKFKRGVPRRNGLMPTPTTTP